MCLVNLMEYIQSIDSCIHNKGVDKINRNTELICDAVQKQ